MSRRKKILIVAGTVLGAAILIPVIRHYQLRFAVANYVAELKAKGEPMDLAQVIPTPVPPEQNGAPLFLKAVALLTTNDDVLNSNPPPAMRGVAPGKAMVGWMRPEIRDGTATNSWEEIRDAMTRNGEALKLLNQMTNHSTFDFNLQYSRRFEMQMINLVLEKRAVQRLSANALFNLRFGDPTSSVKDIQTMLVLVNGTGDERTIISQLVRIALAQIAATATWEFLQSTNLTDESLAGLQEDWSQLEFIEALQRALPVEREGAVTTFTSWRDSNSELQHYFDLQKSVHETLGIPDDEDSIWNEIKTRAKIFLWRYWWSYPDELRYLKGYEVLANTAQSVETNGFFQNALQKQVVALDQLRISKLNDSFDTLFSGQTDFHSMMSESIVTLGAVIKKVMRAEGAKQMTITAIALKRYQLKHGYYPADLNSLVPEFVPAVPLDPVDGQPLRYRPNADETFLLYSVGENGVDDGGDPSLEKGITSSSFNWQNIHALDWVWPQPATEEEIQAYYKKLSFKSN
jgi:hypothetical protein